MKFSIVKYYLKEGLANLSKNKKSAIASTITMCCTLFVFGIFLLISLNTKSLVRNLELEQGIKVFIVTDADEAKVKAVGEKIKEIPEVNSAEFKSKTQGFEELKKQFKDNPGVIAGFDTPDFLPDSYTVKLTDISKSKEVKSKIEKIENVEQVKDEQQLISTILTLSNIINGFTVVITVILIIVSILIISNTIRLAVTARRKEISIMKYVGATDNFIKGPFIVEGIFIGVISTIIVAILLSVLYQVVTINIISELHATALKTTEESVVQTTVTLISLKDIMPTIAATFLVLSTTLGVLGSSISMRKYLDV